MFVGADELWLKSMQESLSLHVLEFVWDGYDPSLTVRDKNDGTISEISISEVDMVVGMSKTCIGYFDDDVYVPCPSSRPVTKFHQCEGCSGESFIPFQECVFEPRCEGDECGLEFCRREHVLYLAYYNKIPKIGMSSTRRVERRLIEQGADAFSIIGCYPNRLRARAAEKELASRLKVSQGIRQTTILQGMTSEVDCSAIASVHDRISSSLRGDFRLTPDRLTFLDGYPISLPLRSPPTLTDSFGRHRGSLIGVKGKWLIYDNMGIRALNLHDIVGRHISVDPGR